MRYISVCSGIEAATSAWHHLGWEPVAFSEIEPFPSAVLKHHYPNVPNWGDMTKYKTWPDATIDLLVGGTPCQSFSIAGLRKGLEDPRGNLMLTFLAIADRYRPKWIVWENVPGVLSSNGGKDFGTFLAALGELGYGWAYRVLDAQWFGVAQRRRRVFVVGCLGDQRRAAQVLFESESVRRDTPPSRAKGQGAAADAQGGVGGGSWWDGGNTAGTLTKQNANGAQRMPDKDNFGAVLQPHAIAQSDVAGSLGSRGNRSHTELDGHGAYVPHAFKVRGGCEGGGKGYLGSDDTAFTVATHQDQHIAQPVAFRDPCPTLTSKMQGSSGWAPANEDAHLVGVTVSTHQDQQIAQPVAFSSNMSVPDCQTNGTTPTLKCGGSDGGNPPAVAFAPADIGPCIGSSGPPYSRTGNERVETEALAVTTIPSMQVRRLTPVECERLQGFPDGHTNIPWRGKAEAPDGPRYKALGNSMAVPVMRWIGERINA